MESEKNGKKQDNIIIHWHLPNDLKNLLKILEESFDVSSFSEKYSRRLSVAPKSCWCGCYINSKGKNLFWFGLIVEENSACHNRIVFEIMKGIKHSFKDLEKDQYGNSIMSRGIDLDDDFEKKDYTMQKDNIINMLNDIYIMVKDIR